MLEMMDLTPQRRSGPALAYLGRSAEPHALRHYAGPERRRHGGSPELQVMTASLDEVDYGMLLLNPELQVLHVNKAARRDLDAHHPLQLLGRELRARHSHDVAPLREALDCVSQRGLHRLLRLGDDIERTCLAVVPLTTADQRRAVLVKLGKRQVCEELTVDWYARTHGLTFTETQVLKLLCTGLKPQEIARQQSVKLSTVRTQIGSIRAKTGTESIRALVREVAVLPPLVSALYA